MCNETQRTHKNLIKITKEKKMLCIHSMIELNSFQEPSLEVISKNYNFKIMY